MSNSTIEPDYCQPHLQRLSALKVGRDFPSVNGGFSIGHSIVSVYSSCNMRFERRPFRANRLSAASRLTAGSSVKMEDHVSELFLMALTIINSPAFNEGAAEGEFSAHPVKATYGITLPAQGVPNPTIWMDLEFASEDYAIFCRLPNPPNVGSPQLSGRPAQVDLQSMRHQLASMCISWSNKGTYFWPIPTLMLNRNDLSLLSCPYVLKVVDVLGDFTPKETRTLTPSLVRAIRHQFFGSTPLSEPKSSFSDRVLKSISEL